MDISYGFNEENYQQARNMGVIFIRYDENKKPVVKYIKDGENKKIAVIVRDHVLDVDIEIVPDRIILASAMEQLGYSEEQTLEMVNFSLVNL